MLNSRQVITRLVLVLLANSTLFACGSQSKNVDLLITGGLVYTGEDVKPARLEVAICKQQICGVSKPGEFHYSAVKVIQAKGLLVAPGFIDPHTHSLEELRSEDKHQNLNYLQQGVTTVINGNDGDGPIDLDEARAGFNPEGIGTNTALLVGHNSLRRHVMGLEKRAASPVEIKQMQLLLAKAMQQGALGLSSGLYYVPGNYAQTSEVVELAKTAAKYNGIYDTHLRDESTFNIGFLAALDEAIEIAETSGIHLHLAHIKALGVDVWGQSKEAIDKISQAQARGLSISADQYPWQASGTFLRSALVPKWLMADSQQAFHQRLNEPGLQQQIDEQINENLRRRGGPESLLVTASEFPEYKGKTLGKIARASGLTPVAMVKKMVQQGRTRVASFNMNMQDIKAFMQQPWVVTSSDGTNGHPRKYASFPQKYQEFVRKQTVLTEQQFIHRSSGLTADVIGLTDRGYIKPGLQADIILFDPNEFKAEADFSHWNKLSSGMQYVLVNGSLVIDKGQFNGKLAGEFVYRGR